MEIRVSDLKNCADKRTLCTSTARGFGEFVERCAILHVEDHDADAYLFRAALDHAGLGVSIYRVSDGEQALAFLHKSGIYDKAPGPDLVVLDLNMPRVDGWTVLRNVKEKAELKDV